MKPIEFSSKEAAGILGLNRKAIGNWLQRGFIKPIRSEQRGKRKHLHFFSYEEIFWMACLRLLAIDLTMVFGEVFSLKDEIMRHAKKSGILKHGHISDIEVLMESIKDGAQFEIPIKFWGKELEENWEIVNDGRLETMPVAGGNVLFLENIKAFVDLRIEKIRAQG